MWGLTVGKTLNKEGKPEFSVWNGGKGTILAPGTISGIKKDFSNTGFLPKVAIVPAKSANGKDALPAFVKEHSEGVEEEARIVGLPIAGDSPFGNREFRADGKYEKQLTREGPVSSQLPTMVKEFKKAKKKALDKAVAPLGAMKDRVKMVF